MGLVFYLLLSELRRGTYGKGGLCRLDYGVFLMTPLKYALLMMLPLIISTYLMYRHEFSYSFVIRYGSWRNLWICQIKKSVVSSILYAVFLMGWVYLEGSGLPLYNWNTQNSYYFGQTYHVLRLHPAEVIGYVFLMCVIRNIIMENILLFFMWQKSFLLGVVFLCALNCFEIVQKKYRVFYWLISPDYAIWTSQNRRIAMFVGAGCYFLAGYLLFRVCINKKELAGHERT